MQAEDRAPTGPQGISNRQEKAHPSPKVGRLVPDARSRSGRTPWPGLQRRRHTLLAMVHAPEAVKLSKVHVRLYAAILAGREGVGGPGAEEPPVRAGAAALSVRVGGLQGQGWALAAGTEGETAGQGLRLPAWERRGLCRGAQASDRAAHKCQPSHVFLEGDEKSNAFLKRSLSDNHVWPPATAQGRACLPAWSGSVLESPTPIPPNPR